MNFLTKMCAKKGVDERAQSGNASRDIATGPGQGKCRGLFIGINYVGQQGELRGCVNDVKMIMKVLPKMGFSLDDSRVLVDTNEIQSHGPPTRANIVDGMKWLVSDAKSGDTLFLHYSGHGTQVPDKSGDEQDGMDEALVPLDYQTAGMIVDDDIFRMVAAPLPDGVRLTAILDCCHSGSAMDLPFTWTANSSNMATVTPDGPAPPMKMGSQWTSPAFLIKLLGSLLTGGGAGITKLISGGMVSKVTSPTAALSAASSITGFSPTGSGGVLPAHVLMFSGCKDTQTSADVSNTTQFTIPTDAGPGGAGGACTAAFTEALLSNPGIPYIKLLELMRENLEKRKFTQVPQLTSSKPVDLGRAFSFFGPIATATAEVVPATGNMAKMISNLETRDIGSLLGMVSGSGDASPTSGLESLGKIASSLFK